MPRAIDLRRVAEWTGTSIEDDSGAQPGAAPLDDAGALPDYEVKVPVGTGRTACATGWRSPSPDELAALNWYR